MASKLKQVPFVGFHMLEVGTKGLHTEKDSKGSEAGQRVFLDVSGSEASISY